MINFSLAQTFFLGISDFRRIIFSLEMLNQKLQEMRISFATIGLLYSCILMVHGWRLDQFYYLVRFLLL
jgi:hypothetical protein